MFLHLKEKQSDRTIRLAKDDIARYYAYGSELELTRIFYKSDSNYGDYKITVHEMDKLLGKSPSFDERSFVSLKHD